MPLNARASTTRGYRRCCTVEEFLIIITCNPIRIARGSLGYPYGRNVWTRGLAGRALGLRRPQRERPRHRACNSRRRIFDLLYRVRKQLVEEGFEAVLSRKQPARPAVLPIFNGEKEAKLIALACSK